MSYFYGRLRGRGRKESTRCGDRVSGVSSELSTWDTKIVTKLSFDHDTGKPMLRIYMGPKEGAGTLVHEQQIE